MKKKILLLGANAHQKVLDGVNLLADAVKLTYGPYGRNFASGSRGGPIHISNDGVSLAKEIEGRDEFEDIGVRAGREAAVKTVELVGDGTTGAIILMQAILKAIGFTAGMVGQRSPVEMVAKIKAETAEVVEKLIAMKEDVASREQLVEVVNVSVEDAALAELVGGTQWDVGPSGTVMVEEHNEYTDLVERINGVRIDNGLGTSNVINNHAKQTLELKDVHILVTDFVFNTSKMIASLVPAIDQVVASGAKCIVIMGRAFDNTAIGWCARNTLGPNGDMVGGFPIFPINAPYTDMNEVMKDLAATVGGKYIQSAERNLESVQSSDFGFSPKLVAARFEGIITGRPTGEDARIDELVAKRVEEITEKLKGTITPFERRGLDTRLAQLTGGTAIIKVGAETEQERHYKKDKVDDAVGSARAAYRGGVVPGAGQALKAIADKLPDDYLLKKALRAPYEQIMTNAGRTFDIPEWVKDPLQVVQVALEKASSIARSLATTEVVVNWEREKPMFVQPVAAAEDTED